jgi:hypothetical protein
MDELQGEWYAGMRRDDDHLVITSRYAVANKAAARIMKQMFNIDITKHKNWTFHEQDSTSDSPAPAPKSMVAQAAVNHNKMSWSWVRPSWPSKPKWKLYPGKSNKFSIELDKAPNAIHRFFQRLILGFRYDKQ